MVIVRNASAGADNAGQKSKGRVRKGESAAKKEKKTEGLTLREDEIRYVGPRKWLMPGQSATRRAYLISLSRKRRY